jgi:hypothetical protein
VDCDLVGAVQREVVALLVEAKGLVDAHAGGADEANQVALCQAQGNENVAVGGSLSASRRESLIHRAAESGYSRKLFTPVDAASCMSIRPALQVAASSSDKSTDPADSDGRTAPRPTLGRLR